MRLLCCAVVVLAFAQSGCAGDPPTIWLDAPMGHGGTHLSLTVGSNPKPIFVQVDDLDATVAKLPEGTDVFVPRRTTFYGATETFLRDAAGNVIVLAQF